MLCFFLHLFDVSVSSISLQGASETNCIHIKSHAGWREKSQIKINMWKSNKINKALRLVFKRNTLLFFHFYEEVVYISLISCSTVWLKNICKAAERWWEIQSKQCTLCLPQRVVHWGTQRQKLRLCSCLSNQLTFLQCPNCPASPGGIWELCGGSVQRLLYHYLYSLMIS